MRCALRLISDLYRRSFHIKIAAIIAEYNPFHNGHHFQIQEIKSQLGDCGIIAIISPDYVQRGEPAFLEKRIRVESALNNGVDLAIELPLPYAVASAERFAFGGVQIALALGCVEYLCFGSESSDIILLKKLAETIDSETIKPILQSLLNNGNTFAKARQMAISGILGDSVGKILSQPNNILAIEYLRQLRGTSITPYAIPRKAVEHDSHSTSGKFASATLLRNLILEKGISSIKEFVPDSAFKLYREAINKSIAPASIQNGEQALLCHLRTLLPSITAGTLDIPDLSEGIENRLYKSIKEATSFEQLLFLLKSKRYTLSRVRRLVLSSFLGIPSNLCFEAPPYIRILGFNHSGTEILKKIKNRCHIPYSTSLSELRSTSNNAKIFAELEANASDLYSFFSPQIQPCGRDYTQKAIYLK